MARRLAESALHVSEHNRDPGVLATAGALQRTEDLVQSRRSQPHRRVAFGEVSLDDLKAVKNHFSCTVNDVVLALCAGALRRYLLARDELPDEPLVGFVPISIRAERGRS